MASFVYKIIPCSLEPCGNGEYELHREGEGDEHVVEQMGLDGWELVAIWPKSEEYLKDFADDEHDFRYVNLGVFKKQMVP